MTVVITPLKDRDSGLALAFLLLLGWLISRLDIFIYLAMAILLIAMTWAKAMRPFAYIWFGLSQILGAVVSRILLAVIWLGMVVPMGLMRKLAGKDTLRLKQWARGTDSVFTTRNHTYTLEDLKNPY